VGRIQRIALLLKHSPGLWIEAIKVQVALITRMDEPLGRFTGNALEVREVLEILDGQNGPSDGLKDYSDTRELTLELAAHMIQLGDKAKNLPEARAMAESLLRGGHAKRKFLEIVKAQGGDIERLPAKAPVIEDLVSKSDGIFRFINVEKVGTAAIHLGAGRKFQTDKLDFTTGIEVLRTNGSKVKKGDLLFRIHAKDKSQIREALAELNLAYVVDSSPSTPSPLVAKVLL
jgi:pyrimidine-nucleoside phosphorylase